MKVAIVHRVQRGEQDNLAELRELCKTAGYEVVYQLKQERPPHPRFHIGPGKVEELKNNPVVRVYRDFYWKLDIDPTKTRPSGEALLRRVLHGKPLPAISTVVDAYNLASLKTIIPLSGFDLKLLKLPLHLRFSRENEEFLGIGMQKPIKLKSNMLVLADETQILCIYPHRDADATKITADTKEVMIVGYGAPGISEQQLQSAVETAISFIKMTSGGEAEAIKVFKP